jgi:hypothetical protein
MNESSSLPRPPALWSHLQSWRIAVPAAAVGWLWLLAACWGQQPRWETATVIALAGWSFSVFGKAAENQLRGNHPPRIALLLAVPAAAASVALALLRWPRGLVASEAGLAALALFQLGLVAGGRWPWVSRVALVVAGLAGLLIIWTAPFAWPLFVRVALMGVLAFSAMQLVQTPPGPRGLRLPTALIRGVIFAAALIAPSAWYAQGGVPRELARMENALFAAVSVIAAIFAQRELATGPPAVERSAATETKRKREALAWLAVLSIITAVAFYAGVTAQHAAHRPMYLASGLAGLVLAFSAGLRRQFPHAAEALREAAMLAPWAILPLVSYLVVGKGWGQSQ